MGLIILEPGFYLRSQALSAAWEGPILYTRGLTNLSFTFAWTDAASPIGTVRVWCTNDPRARNDMQRGLAMSAGEAQWINVKLPAGSVDVDGATATFTADDRNFALTGVGAGKATINLVDIYAFTKLDYTYGSGGVGDTMNVAREGN
jgi:hypothetical protein